jgi:uncharacterized membrane protein
MPSQLIVVTYPTPAAAERVIETVRRLESEHLLEIDEAVYVTRDCAGTVSVTERMNRPLKTVALGAFWGALLGKVFGVPLLGAGIGAVGGALTRARHEADTIDPEFVRACAASLPPGSAAIFSLVRRSTPDKVIAELGKYGGTVLHTSLSEAQEVRLQEAIDTAHGKAKLLHGSRRAPRSVRTRRVVRPNQP